MLQWYTTAWPYFILMSLEIATQLPSCGTPTLPWLALEPDQPPSLVYLPLFNFDKRITNHKPQSQL